ncbi:MAG: DRTGG domain-containing protein [Clostridiales bacterium]|nr:DRTGG domain-containing protein [Clostridiales bacterium]MDD7035162.1 DRTGG domain-containing protein [Bacillota bacterium]MDY2920008.1 DRTGG domain-containing protein [Lentihominibacter sp.]
MMKVDNLAKELGLKKITEAGADREVSGVYIGDLLSVVMSKCEEGNAWITVQTHQNILSVADLNDAACIIIAGDAEIERSLVEKADEMGIALLSSDKEAYELAWRIHEVIE